MAWLWVAAIPMPSHSATSRRVRGLVTSSAGVHLVTDDDCRVVTLDRTRGRLSWQGSIGYFAEIGFDGCSFTTFGDPFVAQGRQPGRQLGRTVGRPPARQPARDLRAGRRRPHRLHPLPPPFPPIPNYSFVTTVVVGGLGGEQRTLNIPPEPASATVARRTLGSTLLYDAGPGGLAAVPGDPASGNGLRAYALAGGTPGCGSGISYDCPTWATPLDGTVATQPVIGDDGATLYVGTDAGTTTPWTPRPAPCAGAPRWARR